MSLSASHHIGYFPEQYQKFHKMTTSDRGRIDECKVMNVIAYFPIGGQVIGTYRIYRGIRKTWKEGIDSVRAAQISRGFAEFIGLGTALLWLVDLIVTLGRYLSVKCRSRSIDTTRVTIPSPQTIKLKPA